MLCVCGGVVVAVGSWERAGQGRAEGSAAETRQGHPAYLPCSGPSRWPAPGGGCGSRNGNSGSSGEQRNHIVLLPAT